MRSVIAASIFFLAAFGAAQGLKADPRYGEGLGVTVNTYSMPATHYGMIQRGGIRYIRRDFAWSEAEQTLGVYRWHTFDRLIRETEAAGQKMLFILDYSNKLYSNTAPRDAVTIQAFARFAAAAVERYKGRGIIWEIWNEPNEAVFWSPQPNVGEYFALLKATSIAIRAVAPDEILIAPAVSGVDFPWLERLFQLGMLDHIDGVSVHPYRYGEPETVLEDYGRLRFLIAQYNNTGREIPVVNSEWGISPGFLGHLAKDQEKHPLRIYFSSLMAGIPLSVHFNWINLGTDQSIFHNRYGLLTAAYAPKASYAKFKFFQERLGGYRFVSRLRLSSPDDYLLLFTDGTSEKLVAYTSKPTPTFPTAVASSAVFDLAKGYGENFGFVASNSGLRIPFDPQPAVVTPRTRSTLLRYAAALPAPPDTVVLNGSNQGADLLAPLFQAIRSPLFPALTYVTIEDRSTDSANPMALTRTYIRSAVPATMPGAIGLLGDFPFVRDTSAAPRRVRITVKIGSLMPLIYETVVYKPSPREVAVSPTKIDGPVDLHIANPSGRVFNGSIRIQQGSIPYQTDFRLEPGTIEANVRLSAPYSVFKNGYTLRILDEDLESGDVAKTVVDQKNSFLALFSDFASSSIGSTVRDYSTSVVPKTGTYSVKTVARLAPGGLPFPGGKAAEIRFTLASKTQDAILLRKNGTRMSGAPYQLSAWVFGEKSYHVLVCRFHDVNNRFYQTRGVTVDWEGWRLVHWDLTGNFETAFGGIDAGKVVYPAYMVQPLVVKARDERASTNGRIIFTNLTVHSLK